MNNQFQELEKQSVVYGQLKDGTIYEEGFDRKKFAELILRECIDTLDQMPVYYKNENDRQIERDTISDCIRAIEQRFGI
jgi:hypothetical protein